MKWTWRYIVMAVVAMCAMAVSGDAAARGKAARSAAGSVVAGSVAVKGGDDVEAQFRSCGLVDISTLDVSIVVDLKYATTDNFVGRNMYGTLTKAYFRREIAKALVKVQAELKKINPRYSLVIYDAARPQSAQWSMWRAVKDTPYRRYVARPHRGGHHNFGVAVDLSILLDGKPVDMGSKFDSFGAESHIDNERQLLKQKKITKAAYDNRQLLRRLMRAQGFTTYRREWWHFQRYTIGYARTHFPLLDF